MDGSAERPCFVLGVSFHYATRFLGPVILCRIDETESDLLLARDESDGAPETEQADGNLVLRPDVQPVLFPLPLSPPRPQDGTKKQKSFAAQL
jgi:hypothetical protein